MRRGDDRAFESSTQRYQRRIHAYVLGMVKDHGRAEDVTQEVFVSALRRMRETERPIAFKPWIYEIAKNACIDHFRRSRRAEEVSYDADDALAPADHGRLVGPGPTPDAAVAVKQDLDNLCGAFGGLSDVPSRDPRHARARGAAPTARSANAHGHEPPRRRVARCSAPAAG